MKTKLLISFMVLCGIVNAQIPNWTWVKSAGGTLDDFAKCHAVDASGNIYVTGRFQSPTITFDSITLTNTSTSVDLFLVKYDANGNVIWAKGAVGIGADIANTVTVDASGNIYIAGSFASPTIIFGSDTLTNYGTNHDMFLAKYDSNGNVIWAKSSGGNNSDEAFTVTTDGSGNIFVGGEFVSTTITFGSFTLTNFGNTADMFLVKYNSGGNVIWAKRAGGNYDDGPTSIKTDGSGNIIVTGYYKSSTIIFDSFTLTNTTINYEDMFLAKYDNSGNVIWAKSAGGSLTDHVYSFTTDNSGNIFVAGYFVSSTITFGSFTLTNAGGGFGYYDMFFVKYDNSGNVLWAKRAGGTSYDEALSVTTDEIGNVYVAGHFTSLNITFGTYTFNLSSNKLIFIVKYDNSGNVIWAMNAGGGYHGYFNTITYSVYGNLVFSGYFSGPTIIFGSDTISTVNIDMGLAKLSPVLEIESITNQNNISVYPNPASGNISILAEGGSINSMEIYNIMGEKVYLETDIILQEKFDIDISHLPGGIYFVKAGTNKGVQTEKMVVE